MGDLPLKNSVTVKARSELGARTPGPVSENPGERDRDGI